MIDCQCESVIATHLHKRRNKSKQLTGFLKKVQLVSSLCGHGGLRCVLHSRCSHCAWAVQNVRHYRALLSQSSVHWWKQWGVRMWLVLIGAKYWRYEALFLLVGDQIRFLGKNDGCPLGSLHTKQFCLSLELSMYVTCSLQWGIARDSWEFCLCFYVLLKVVMYRQKLMQRKKLRAWMCKRQCVLQRRHSLLRQDTLTRLR